MNYTVKFSKQHTVYSGYHQINQVHLKYEHFEGGWSSPIQHEVIVRKDVVAILLFDPERSRFVFIEQFRTGACIRLQEELQEKSPWLLEIVAGDVETGESFEEVAIREVLEETGLTLQACLPIYEYWISPANHSGKIIVFLGKVDSSTVSPLSGLKKEGEDIRTHIISIEKAYLLLKERKITYAPAIIALQWFWLNEAWVRNTWLVE